MIHYWVNKPCLWSIFVMQGRSKAKICSKFCSNNSQLYLVNTGKQIRVKAHRAAPRAQYMQNTAKWSHAPQKYIINKAQCNMHVVWTHKSLLIFVRREEETFWFIFGSIKQHFDLCFWCRISLEVIYLKLWELFLFTVQCRAKHKTEVQVLGHLISQSLWWGFIY